jgi:predicted nucleic acid-binding protein
MSVLVDSSAWIAYLRGAGDPTALDVLIDEGLIATNDLILAELIPPLLVQRRRRLVNLLRNIERFPIDVGWGEIIQMQTTCMRHGINGVGIPDLIIAQNAIQHRLQLLTLDKHFEQMGEHLPLMLY